MTTTIATALVPSGPVFSEPERLALAGFLAGYSGLTREAYALDLRQFASWCHRRQRRGGPASSASAAAWKPPGGPGPRSPAG